MTELPAAGLLLIDKPERWTSHDVVAFLRPILGTRRVGHAGTLDPLASGLLVIVYGHATKLADVLHRSRKTYLADVALGAETTTDDREGAVTLTAAVPEIDDAFLRRTLAAFVGRHDQTPPAYSALHVEGRRAYQLARRGEAVALAARPVEIDALDLVAREPALLRVQVSCSAGTYIRALARDIGRALGTRAHLGALRRLCVGPFSVDDAFAPSRIREMSASGLADRVIPEDAARGLLARERADLAPPGAHDVSTHEGN